MRRKPIKFRKSLPRRRSGFLTWLYAFGGARRQPDDSEVDVFVPIAPTGSNTHTVDVLSLNGLANYPHTLTVYLSVNGANMTTSGPWSVANNIITYTPASTPTDGFTDQIQYVIADNQSALATGSKPLVITYVSVATNLTFNLTSSTTPVTYTPPFAAADGFALVNPGDAWTLTVDPTTKLPTVTFDPAKATSQTASVAYTVGPPSNTAQLMAVYPAAGLTFVAPDKTHTSYDFTIPSTILGFAPGTTSSGGGSWSFDKTSRKLTFTPPAGFTSGTPYTTSYTATNMSGSANVAVWFPADVTLSGCLRQYTSGMPTTIDLYVQNNQKNAAPAPVFPSFTITSVTETTSPSSGGTWTISNTTIYFQPPQPAAGQPATVLQITAATATYEITFADKSTTTATVTLNFTTGLQAYNITYSGFTASSLPKPLPVPFLNFCYIPAGFATALLDGTMSNNADETDAQGKIVAHWAYSSSPSQVITLSVSNSANPYTITYTVVDKNGVESLPATITVNVGAGGMTMARVRAADILMTTDLIGQTPPAQTAVDVLAASSAFFRMDPKSVVLTGMVNVGQDYSHWQEALVQQDGKNDGKSLHVPEEGVWMVDDKGMIGFSADPKLTHPPTPVGYTFKDVMGNQSNMAAIVIDPKLTDALAAPATLGTMTDQDFWDAYQKHVSRPQPYLDPRLFIAITGTLAGAIVTLAPVGGNPVSDDDFDKAYETWVAHKPHHWDDPKGTAKPVGLFTVCKNLVDSSTPLKATKYGNRYWRLTLMARMAAQTLPPVPTN